MEIYFINIEEFLKNVDTGALEVFLENNKFSSAKRQKEFCLGRFLLNYVLKNRFGIETPEIIIKNKKPCLKESNDEKACVKFSLTHSNGFVMAAFSDKETGIDLELMKERNFDKLFDFYNLTPETRDKQTFYQLWTEYEACIKLQKPAAAVLSGIFKKNYALSVCSSQGFDIIKTLKIYELKIPAQSTNPKELINLKLVIDSKKNENALVIQEISTAASEEAEFLPLKPLNLKIE